MTIILSDETQHLLEERMKLNGISNADDAVRELLLEIEPSDRGSETKAAIQRGMEQSQAGLGRPWEEVKQELAERRLKRETDARSV